MVIERAQLMATGMLLDALEQRVPSMSVSRPLGGGCPTINLRGQARSSSASNPSVYVDDTRMGDTCILLQIATSDVERVELYPVSARRPPGFAPGPGGLILVYRIR